LLISIPMVIFGSTLLMKFMERWPIIITIGGALLAGSPAKWPSRTRVKDWSMPCRLAALRRPALGAVASS